MNIQLFICGGTIDKVYDEIQEKLVFTESQIGKLLKQSRSKVGIQVDQLMLLDSLDMTDDQRSEIVRSCKNCELDRIVITHGTGTMEKTAKLLSENIKDKVIVLTGAMVPYSIANSDALFNVGSAIIAAQTMPYGVYIAMNGLIFDAQKAHKNTVLGIFEEA